MNALFRKLSWLSRRSQREAELREELQFHLEEEAEEHGPAAARRDLGNLTRVQEDTRAAWTWTWCEHLAQDVRYAWRTMAANKTFSSLAILSLALGIGANTAIFSFMDSILLRSLPVHDPAALVRLAWHTRKSQMHGTVMHDSAFRDQSGYTSGVFPYPAYDLLRDTQLFSSTFAYYGVGRVNLAVQGRAEIGDGEYVSGDYFTCLGIPPAAGRLLGLEDDLAGAPSVAMVSFAFSQKRFGGPDQAPGQTILINNLSFTVAGVTPPEFFGTDPEQAPDFYLPMHANLLIEASDPEDPPGKRYLDPQYQFVEVMGRLRPGITRQQALAVLAPRFANWAASVNTSKQERDDPQSLLVFEGAAGLDSLRREYSKPLYVLLTLVGLILAIACANLANLLLARATARRREIAVRLGMGAGRLRVVRQLLTESVVLAGLGGMLGVAFAIWGVRALTFLLANGRDKFTLHAEVNWRVLAVTASLALLTGLVFGLAPALQATRVDLLPALKGSWGSDRRARLNLSHTLVAAQIALSLVILVAAGLFVRTLSNLHSIELGFNRENLLIFQLDARQAGHPESEIPALFADLQRKFRAIPGVRDVGMSFHSLVGDGMSGLPQQVDGKPIEDSLLLAIGPGFFSTMQIPLLLGREITERDQPGTPHAAIVNEQFAAKYFAGQNPIGHHVSLGGQPGIARTEFEVVGVSRNARYNNIRQKYPPLLYYAYNQSSWPRPSRMVFELRTAGNPLVYARDIREIVRQADPRMPVADLRTETAQIDATINQQIVFARLATALAILALAIACVGLFSTMSYTVARRTSEIGIRMALGAPRQQVVWMVLREVLVLATLGLAVGYPAVRWGSKLVKSFLYGTEPADPLALAIAIATLLTAALLAGYLPARSASRIDPMTALRHD